MDPTTSALFLVLGATATVIGLHALVEAIRRRRHDRRWTVRDDVVIDLTFVESAIEHDRAVADRVVQWGGRRRAGSEEATAGGTEEAPASARR